MILLLLLSTIAAMLGVIALRGAVTELRVAGKQRVAKSGLYCAEAGLNAARGFFASNYTSWPAMFGDPNFTLPAGYPVTGDLDGDGLADYQVTLKDNVDELPPATNNPLRDNDYTAIVVSRCISSTLAPHQLEEIVVVNAVGTNYRSQSGHGSNHSGNEN